MFDEKIIILNAPPSAGKDEIANYLQFYYEVKKEEMKTPLFTIGAAILGMTEDGFRERYSDRGWKESVHPFIGVSARQLFINISEKMLKPMLGQQVFGKLAANRLSKADVWWQGIVFSDGGFDYELSPLIEKFGADSIYVIRLHREGCTFDNDSRDYLTKEQLDEIGIFNVMDFTNDQPNVNLMCEAFIKQFKERFEGGEGYE